MSYGKCPLTSPVHSLTGSLYNRVMRSKISGSSRSWIQFSSAAAISLVRRKLGGHAGLNLSRGLLADSRRYVLEDEEGARAPSEEVPHDPMLLSCFPARRRRSFTLLEWNDHRGYIAGLWNSQAEQCCRERAERRGSCHVSINRRKWFSQMRSVDFRSHTSPDLPFSCSKDHAPVRMRKTTRRNYFKALCGIYVTDAICVIDVESDVERSFYRM